MFKYPNYLIIEIGAESDSQEISAEIVSQEIDVESDYSLSSEVNTINEKKGTELCSINIPITILQYALNSFAFLHISLTIC